MKAFKFRLQTVLDMRRREEEARSRELAAALNMLVAENARLTELRILEADALAEYHRLQQAGPLDVQAIQWFQAYSVGIGLAIREQLQRVAEAERHAEARRAALLDAARAKEVLDQLKDKALEAYRQAEDRAEAKALDEMATQRHARKS